MKPVRNLVRNIAAVAAVVIIVLCASLVVAESDAHKSFDLLKGMEGNWAGKNNQGQPIQVTFRLTAGGSALMSESGKHGHHVSYGWRPPFDDAHRLGVMKNQYPVSSSQWVEGTRQFPQLPGESKT